MPVAWRRKRDLNGVIATVVADGAPRLGLNIAARDEAVQRRDSALSYPLIIAGAAGTLFARYAKL